MCEKMSVSEVIFVHAKDGPGSAYPGSAVDLRGPHKGPLGELRRPPPLLNAAEATQASEQGR